jgi:hypothetical protein
MIASREISVVIQGGISRPKSELLDTCPSTLQVIESVRKHLPDSQLILSTWEGENVSDLDYDDLVFSKDPGSLGERDNVSYANILRQLRSTRSGLLKARRSYALKLRSDTILTSASFLSEWQSFAHCGMKPFLFKSKILVSAIFTPRPVYCPSPYYVADLFSFGHLEDMVNLWSAPELEIRSGFDFDMDRIKKSTVKSERCINAEQRLILGLLSANGVTEELSSFTSVNPFQLMRSEKFIASHFLPVDPESSGLGIPTRFKKYRYHHAFRGDYRGPLFRSKNQCVSTSVWYIGVFPILFACAKGIFGMLLRKINSN